ncbi:MAG: hypothetical protein CMQ53_04950 [Gammaproteobacteria bacterium]|nr:hypothetical protein [Gammaproteobacteria bacterium]
MDKVLEINKIEEKVNNYEVLSVTRMYIVLVSIGKYKLERYNFDNYKEVYWYNWRYYAYRSPIWRNRFDKYKIKVDDKNKDIVFLDEDEEEEFCKMYDYEPDEQSLEIQNCSLIELKMLSEVDMLEKKVTKLKI